MLLLPFRSLLEVKTENIEKKKKDVKSRNYKVLNWK